MNFTAFIVPALIIAGVVVIVWVSVSKSRDRRDKDAADGVVLSLPTSKGHLRLTGSSLIEGHNPAIVHPLEGLVASIEDSGTVNRRFTLTRMATLGVAALTLPKKLDDRELYITIEGPQTVIVRAIALKSNPTAAVAARQFVARINQAAQSLKA